MTGRYESAFDEAGSEVRDDVLLSAAVRRAVISARCFVCGFEEGSQGGPFSCSFRRIGQAWVRENMLGVEARGGRDQSDVYNRRDENNLHIGDFQQISYLIPIAILSKGYPTR